MAGIVVKGKEVRMENLPNLIAECKEALNQPPPITVLPCKICGEGIELVQPQRFMGVCRKCRQVKKNEKIKSWRKDSYGGRVGKCKMPSCGRVFKLRSWQHPTLHWCNKCRRLDTYQDFASFEGRRKRFSPRPYRAGLIYLKE